MSTSTSRLVWPASDLARRRKDILNEAASGAAFVRASDGSLFVLVPAERLSGIDDSRRQRALLIAVINSVSTDEPDPSTLGEIAFVAGWPMNRRRQFAEDLNNVIAHAAATRNADEIDAFLELSTPRPAMGVIDPERIRAALTR